MCARAGGKLLVWTADFGRFLSEFATQSEAPPEQLAWCGTDSVVLYWEVCARAACSPCSCSCHIYRLYYQRNFRMRRSIHMLYLGGAHAALRAPCLSWAHVSPVLPTQHPHVAQYPHETMQCKHQTVYLLKWATRLLPSVPTCGDAKSDSDPYLFLRY